MLYEFLKQKTTLLQLIIQYSGIVCSNIPAYIPYVLI